jgi:hypothetical protein
LLIEIATNLRSLLKLFGWFFQSFFGSLCAFFLRMTYAKVSTIKPKWIFFVTIELVNYIGKRYIYS